MWEVSNKFHRFPRLSRGEGYARASGLPTCDPGARIAAGRSYGLQVDAAAYYPAPIFELATSLRPIAAPTSGGRHGRRG
jgi:hypothetical protein